jgi:uncharacterized protein
VAVIEEMLPPWSVLGSILDRGQLLQPRQKVCGVGDDYVVVDQHGRIAQCHMELSKTLGDVRRVDPVRAIRSDSAPIRNLLVDDKAGCRDCTWRHWCSGGCAVATLAATGRFDARSPNCAIYKTIYPEAVRSEGMRLLAFARTHSGRAAAISPVREPGTVKWSKGWARVQYAPNSARAGSPLGLPHSKRAQSSVLRS